MLQATPWVAALPTPAQNLLACDAALGAFLKNLFPRKPLGISARAVP
jgi:hypothetical protein